MIPWLDEITPIFPSLDNALEEPNGLLCAGGNLEVPTLYSAYSRGIFPWPIEHYPLLWWSPTPRMVMTPERFRFARRFTRFLRGMKWQVVVNQNFSEIIRACAHIPRAHQDGSWITQEMQKAYIDFHQAGFAHSIEVRDRDNRLCGGLYGVGIGRVFFGESMFSRESNASKVALAFLMHSGCYDLVDCQMVTAHLESLGGFIIPRDQFVDRIDALHRRPATDLVKALSQVTF